MLNGGLIADVGIMRRLIAPHSFPSSVGQAHLDKHKLSRLSITADMAAISKILPIRWKPWKFSFPASFN